MRKLFFNWQALLALCLILLSGVIYYFHYLLFHDSHHIFIYLVGDIAFVPIEVLLVTLIIHRLLEARSKKEKLRKLNMVIGAFYSEVGTDLIGEIASFDTNVKALAEILQINENWDDKDFILANKKLENYSFSFLINNDNLLGLRDFLHKKRQFLLGLLENPNLLEHDYFTDLLWAVFHLIEELISRSKNNSFSDSDLEHLKVDINRAYLQLIKEWLYYTRHLKKDYPFLYAYLLRTNPFASKV